jgi:hypothetical protein
VSLENFVVNDKNLNTVGGGCLCSPDRQATGCEGPFVVFPASMSESLQNQHCVVSEKCLRAALKKIDQGAIVAAGEDGPH